METRVENRSLPEIQILDLRKQDEKPNAGNLPFWLSPLLYDKILKSLENNKQAALFLNRRGVAPLVICPDCGFTFECPNCDINLTLHGKSHLVCHYCDYHENLKEICPDCHQGELKPVGLGTELIEKDIQALFPGAVVARADRDEIQNREDLENMISKMESGEINILVGTQMIAKGLDFPNLNLVGLILADVGFNLPDFRATERSFQLITQVSGRAGRHVVPGDEPGQVIVQTYNTEHPSLQFALKNDFEGFAKLELEHRAALNYPPFGRLAVFRIQSTHLSRSQETARLLARRGLDLKGRNAAYADIEILGPAEAPLSKLRGQFRFHLLVKAKDNKTLNAFCRQLLGKEDWTPAGVRISVDVDPIHLL
jgi:primosomal protein N' (replication factor Y)